jgi:glutamyl/glutaminyl-tRNA synthetase
MEFQNAILDDLQFLKIVSNRIIDSSDYFQIIYNYVI